jgi:putative YhdH/YhfP family quinone oxidoreductase
MNYSAYVVRETEKGVFNGETETLNTDNLPEGSLLVRVKYSSLNYKDALSSTGNKGVTREFPHTPGIDAAGVVAACTDGRFREGDEVIVTGHSLGMSTAGGYGEYIRVPSEWAVPLPDGLSLRESMILGTAGLTAALCIMALAGHGISPSSGEIAVTGATGGVGSLAVAILSKLGFEAVGVTGKPEGAELLKSLGAKRSLSREEFSAGCEKPLMKTVWGGGVDVVGGEMLAALLKSTKYGGAVSCCGLAGSPDLNINVFPFILRGVSLFGIDSAECPTARKQRAWNLLSGDWKPEGLESLVTEIGLEGLSAAVKNMLAGGSFGRTVVKL